MSEMPPIAGLRLNHGRSKGSIFLYESILIDMTNNSVVEVHRFNTFITDKPTVFRGVTCNPNNLDPFDGLNLLELPKLDWTPSEYGIISSFFIMITGSVVLVFEYFNIFPINQEQEGSLFRSALSVSFTLLIVLPLFAATTLFYKFFLKR